MLTAELRSIDAWRARAPQLHIGDEAFIRKHAPLELSPQQRTSAAAAIKLEGYYQGNVGEWGIDIAATAATVRALSEQNLSPVFAYVYDEYWIPFHRLHSMFANLLGGQYFMLPDCWIWNVDPRKGDAGWPPHRDQGAKSIFPNRMPKSLTTWIPLSPAMPVNGCMYLVPANLDPTYGTERDYGWKFELPSIRALPGKPGDYFMWSQAVVHWGGKTSPLATESRVSMAFEFQRADMPPQNQPLMQPRTILNFDQRLRLIAKQILQYRHMYEVAPEVEQVATELLA